MTYLEIKDDLLKAIELARAVKREPSKRFDEVLKSGDFSSTKSQIAFSDYITSLSNDCGIAIASIMLIGRDGIIGYHGTKDEILTETMEEL
ncbi:MAG: hypothetical protein HGJ97_17955, partial [Desulfosporosinus sp.]|nr:hypothetical protein [Desulfosporosinus sp.]